MRQFLCMSQGPGAEGGTAGRRSRSTSGATIRTRTAARHTATGNPDNVSISGLQRMSDLLSAAVAPGAHPVERSGPVLGDGVGLGQQSARSRTAFREPLRARWVSEALYRMWYAGVSRRHVVLPARRRRARREVPVRPLHTLLGRRLLRPAEAGAAGLPRSRSSPFGSGRNVRVWGRTPPSSTTTTVVLERSARAGGVRVGTAEGESESGSSRGACPRPSAAATVPASPGGEASLGFSLKRAARLSGSARRSDSRSRSPETATGLSGPRIPRRNSDHRSSGGACNADSVHAMKPIGAATINHSGSRRLLRARHRPAARHRLRLAVFTDHLFWRENGRDLLRSRLPELRGRHGAAVRAAGDDRAGASRARRARITSCRPRWRSRPCPGSTTSRARERSSR